MNNLKESDKIIHDKPILKDVATEPFKYEDKLLPPITSNETEINDGIEGQSNNIESTNVLDTSNMSDIPSGQKRRMKIKHRNTNKKRGSSMYNRWTIQTRGKNKKIQPEKNEGKSKIGTKSLLRKGDIVEYQVNDSTPWKRGRVVNRGGKASSKLRKNIYNLTDEGTDENVSVDLNLIKDYVITRAKNTIKAYDNKNQHSFKKWQLIYC